MAANNLEEEFQNWNELKAIFESCKDRLDQESYLDAWHYLGFGEPEMAYESFCLSLILSDAVISVELQKRLLFLGLYYKLDQETVFENRFWEMMQAYLGVS